MLHKHPNSKADSVSRIGFEPAFYVGKKLGFVLSEHLWRELVAGGPVVHIGKKAFYQSYTPVVVLDLRKDKGMELVLVEICMGQGVQECADVILLGQFFCQLA